MYEYYYQHNHQVQEEEEEQEIFLQNLHDLNDIFVGCNGANGFSNGQHFYSNISPLRNGARTQFAPDMVPEFRDLGAEGDLFKPPEPTVPAPEAGRVGNDDEILMLSEAFYRFRDEFLEKTIMEETFPELADMEFPTLDLEDEAVGSAAPADGPMQKSVSCECLRSSGVDAGGDGGGGGGGDFPAVDLFGATFGLRRAYSEGDIKAVGNGNAIAAPNTSNILHPTYEQVLWNVDDFKMEERKQKLSRYRKKRNKRNFDRKIKYACRKALADNQPRVRGRFARTEECFGGAKMAK